MSNETVKFRVLQGVKWLHINYPEWYHRVDLDRLSMASSKDCIAGQILGDYDNLPGTTGWRVSRGFTSTCGEWEDLNEEWTRVVRSFIEPITDPVTDWERDVLDGPSFTQGDVDSAREQGRAEGITAFQNALTKVDHAAAIAGLELNTGQIVALTNSLIDQGTISL